MVEIAASCVCGSIGAPPEVRFCQECHRYWRGDKELLSVSKVLRSTWPFKPDFSAAPAAVIENARYRGIEVDALVSAYVVGKLKAIPAGTRTDSRDLFFKFKRWWDDHKHGDVESQAILADDNVAGTCDIRDGSTVWDVKSTHDIEPMYPVQLGAYGELHFSTYKEPVKALGIIHLTKRYATPKIIKLDPAEVIKDWMVLRDTYFMAVRRST